MHRVLQHILSSLTLAHYHERCLFTVCAKLVGALVVNLSQRLDKRLSFLAF